VTVHFVPAFVRCKSLSSSLQMAVTVAVENLHTKYEFSMIVCSYVISLDGTNRQTEGLPIEMVT